MTPDNAAVLAGIVLAMLWPIHQHLTIRALRYSLHHQREQLHQHHRAIIQLQATAPEPPTSAGQPMPTVGRPGPSAGRMPPGGIPSLQAMATVGRPRVGQQSPPKVPPVTTSSSQNRPKPPTRPRPLTNDPDPTLRLKRPPALSDIEATIARAGRCLTPTELATELERKPWDLLPELERLTNSGRIKLVLGHTAGQSAYTLADPTVRLSRMPVLWGATP